MERVQANLRAFYERQALKLLLLAHGCGDPGTAKKLVEMASEYTDKLDIAASERLTAEANPMSH